MKISYCQVNHLTNPLGYDLPETVFTWQVEESNGKRPVESRIVVENNTKVVADTGWGVLNSLGEPVKVPLEPRTRYTWTVAVRSDAGEEAVSEPQSFETGKMAEPWQARWIGCDDAEPRHPVFSKTIVPAGPVKSARLYICGLGLYEAAWNGNRIGQEILTPYCNNYNAWVQYQTYDLTGELRGDGVLSVMLGNGWYKGRFGFDKREEPCYGSSFKLIAELHILYEDGHSETICTDDSWQVTRSAITFSNIYDGETVDTTLPPVEAVPARLVDAPKGRLSARLSTPVCVQQELPVQRIFHTPRYETVLDIGQNMTGSFRLRVQEPAGTHIHLQFGEIMQNDCFYRDNLRTARAEYTFVTNGEPQVIEPHFTFYGYRYVKVEGVSHLRAEDFTALLLHSDLPRTGCLETGNRLVSQLIHNAEWSHVDNFLDVPTDCPQRDERMGWTGDAQVFAPTACYQRDSYAFLAKYLYDMSTEQAAAQGMVPMTVPAFGMDNCSAAWGDAACFIPWTLYQMYGDLSILRNQYDSMRSWVDYITSVDGNNHGWRRHFHFGDWLSLDVNEKKARDSREGGTDKGYIASVMYRRCALIVAETATLLGKTEDAETYSTLAARLLNEIRGEYFSPLGRSCIDTQTALLLALTEGLTPDSDRTARELSEKLWRNNGMLETGFVGTPLLCPTLTATGHEDQAFDLLLNEEYPGWLYEVNLGATTIWERWNSVLPDGRLSGTDMNSLNHYAYGSIVAWLYQDVAGIRPVEPGFSKALLAPHLHPSLGHCTGTYRSAAGTWKVSWEIMRGGEVRYTCEVPFGCTAHLILPYGGGEYDLEAGSFSRTWTAD